MWFHHRWVRILAAALVCAIAGTGCAGFSETAGCVEWGDSQVPYRTINIGDRTTRIHSANDAGAVAGQYTADGPSSMNSDRTRGFYLSPDGELATFSVGGSTTLVGAMNSSGEIAGRTGYGGFPSTGFVRSPDGEVREFALASSGAAVISITEAGDVVGSRAVNELWLSAFLDVVRSDGVQLPYDGYDELLLDSFYEPRLVATNDLGWAAGNVDLPGHRWDAFVIDPSGAVTFIMIDDANATIVTDMNSMGDIVGSYERIDGRHGGFIVTSVGELSTFEINGKRTTPTAINDAREVAGAYRSDPGSGDRSTSGFFRSSDGDITTFRLPVATRMTISDLTSSGVIVGYTAPPRLGLADEETFIIDTRRSCVTK